VDKAHVVVLDDFVSASDRKELLDWITEPGKLLPVGHHCAYRDQQHMRWSSASSPSAGWDHRQGPPTSKWERATCDAAFLPRTWGLQAEVLQQMAAQPPRAMVEVQTRLCKLFPDMTITHMPSEQMQNRAPAAQPCIGHDRNCDASTARAAPEQHAGLHTHPPVAAEEVDEQQRQPAKRQRTAGKEQQVTGTSSTAQPAGQISQHADAQAAVATAAAALEQGSTEPQHDPQQHSQHRQDSQDASEASDSDEGGAGVDCNQFVANAAVHGDSFTWHVDADPWDLPESSWTKQHGHYFNRVGAGPVVAVKHCAQLYHCAGGGPAHLWLVRCIFFVC
jgi:hypothetical protein